jgi:hypothetical protein
MAEAAKGDFEPHLMGPNIITCIDEIFSALWERLSSRDSFRDWKSRLESRSHSYRKT